MLKLTLKQQISFVVGIVATAAPTILVAILASFYYYLGVESFFNDKVSKAISDTVKVAQLYLEEHKENIKSDIYGIANIIERDRYILAGNPKLISALLENQSSVLNLSEVVLFTREGLIARNTLGFPIMFEEITYETLQAADESMGAIILKEETNDKVRALLRLNNFIDHTYLLIGRYVDREIINHLAETSDSAAQYSILWGNIALTRNKLILLFIFVSSMLCVTAIFISNRLSNFIINPLIRFVDATKLIKDGNFTTRVPENKSAKEIKTLAKAFNSMIEHIAVQRFELIQANDLIDARRRFIETILIELSSGVIVLDLAQNVTLYNHVVHKLLRLSDEKNLMNLKVIELLPEIAEILEDDELFSAEHIEKHLIIYRENQSIHLFLRIGFVKNSAGTTESIIITIAEITDLVAAQKAAAWAEIAKRIAHEVKNPLTPIHLAAERLKKKYIKQISYDSETFVRYIDTIIRHVSDIEFMLSEFLNFARTPAPQFAVYNICRIINEVLFLQRNAFKNITYVWDNDLKKYDVYCDRTQVTQILINLLKNAAESITKNPKIEGKISISLSVDNKYIIIHIRDNGGGIDKKLLDKLTEPYITTKSRGTGLGLSIVNKLVTDNGGKFEIYNIEGGGVCAEFSLKISPPHVENEYDELAPSINADAI